MAKAKEAKKATKKKVYEITDENGEIITVDQIKADLLKKQRKMVPSTNLKSWRHSPNLI